MSRTTETTPWKDGCWQIGNDNTDIVCIVKGSNVTLKGVETNDILGKWTFGKFETAPKKLMEMTGMSEFNIRMTYDLGHLGLGTPVFHGILTKNGTKCYMKCPAGIRKYQWLDEDVDNTNDKLPNLMDRRSRLCPATKLGEPPLKVALPKNILINAPARAIYKYKPPHLLPLFTNTERLKYLEAKLASQQLEENQELSTTLLRKR